MTEPRRAPGSFGRRQSEPEPQGEPVPVLHVGEVHADLRLTISAETLNQLGSQIATVIANATRQGFDAGMNAVSGDMADDVAADAEVEVGVADLGGTLPTGLSIVRNNTGAAEPVIDPEMLRRGRGEGL